MNRSVEGGSYRCALVVDYWTDVDRTLLAAIAEATGLGFQEYGHASFGKAYGEVYAAGGHLMLEVSCIEAQTKAMFVWAESAECAAAVRDVIGAAMPVWSEPMLRAQLERSLEREPERLVALMMACGGGDPEQGTLDLLQRALDHQDQRVRQAAEYARLVASELGRPPVVTQEEREEILRPVRPVSGYEDWVTVRAGVVDRAVPRPVTWLRTRHRDPDEVVRWLGDNWGLATIPYGDDIPAWYEEIYVHEEDERTAMHVVWHKALGRVHIALHGDAVDATAAALVNVRQLKAKILDGQPEGWERTSP